MQKSPEPFDKWGVFRIMELDTLNRIKFAVIFGHEGDKLVFVTKEDKVFSFGYNDDGCLGFPATFSRRRIRPEHSGRLSKPLLSNNVALEPNQIARLCKKKVCSFATGEAHVLVITEDGQLYSWGRNSKGQCTSNDPSLSIHIASPTRLTFLPQLKAKQVACGNSHSMVLSDSGSVWTWGGNEYLQLGIEDPKNCHTPIQPTDAMKDRLSVSIACCESSSFALQDTGEVISWGNNDRGQLGLGRTDTRKLPRKVSAIRSCIVTSMVCGNHHILVLTTDGDIYSWGWNHAGQLGLGTNPAMNLIPEKVKGEGTKFVEIAASNVDCLSVAVSNDKKIYVWGSCKLTPNNLPVETRCKTMNEAFAKFSDSHVTCQPLVSNKRDNSVLIEHSFTINADFREQFDNKESCDTTFEIDGNSVYVHKSYLVMRSQYLHALFLSFDKSESTIIKVTEYSYPVYRAYLEYFYTNVVSLDVVNATKLLGLSISFNEEHLKIVCEQTIKRQTTVQNVLLIHQLSKSCPSEVLEEFCRRYAIKNLKALALDESFSTADDEFVTDIMTQAAHIGVFCK